MAFAIRLFLLIPAFFMISCSNSLFEGKLTDGKLRPCPEKPNCINSEAGHPDRNSITPIPFQGDPVLVMRQLKDVIETMGGEVLMNDDVYLWAIFRSKIFRFIDDLEIRIDSADKLVHIRSGARSGYSDLGVNRRRVLEIFRQFQLIQKTDKA